MPTPPPRHLATPRRPWRLLLFVFGLTTAVLAALVASATLLPQPEPPRRVPGVALSTLPTQPAPTSASTTTTSSPGNRPPRLPHPPLQAQGGEPSADRPRPPGSAPAQAPATVGGTTPPTAPSTVGATTQPIVTAPSTTAGPTTTAPTSTVASTTTLVTTTSIAPTTGPTTSAAPTSTGPTDRAGATTTGPTTTGAATTTTGPVILSGSRPAGVSAATVGALLPILGLLYLLRGLVPQAGGTHARRRRASHPRRRG